MLEELITNSDEENLWITGIAMCYIQLGAFDLAFKYLDQSVLDRNGWIIYLAVEPAFDPIREDPRYEILIKKLGLTEYLN